MSAAPHDPARVLRYANLMERSFRADISPKIPAVAIEDIVGYLRAYADALPRLERLARAAEELLRLKAGPRDDAYRAAKEPAWRALADAIAAQEGGE